jgi:hypothetical protein
LNNSLAPENDIENNQKVVNSLILACLLDSAHIYNVAEQDQLMEIALKCPVTSGDAVYQARNILMTIAQNIIEFEDNCSVNERRFVSSEDKIIADFNTGFKLYPNPNNGQMVLEYHVEKSESAFLEITDLTGHTMERYQLLDDSDKLKINSEVLMNGMYIYKVIVNDKIVKSDKLIIIK